MSTQQPIFFHFLINSPARFSTTPLLASLRTTTSQNHSLGLSLLKISSSPATSSSEDEFSDHTPFQIRTCCFLLRSSSSCFPRKVSDIKTPLLSFRFSLLASCSSIFFPRYLLFRPLYIHFCGGFFFFFVLDRCTDNLSVE